MSATPRPHPHTQDTVRALSDQTNEDTKIRDEIDAAWAWYDMEMDLADPPPEPRILNWNVLRTRCYVS